MGPRLHGASAALVLLLCAPPVRASDVQGTAAVVWIASADAPAAGVDLRLGLAWPARSEWALATSVGWAAETPWSAPDQTVSGWLGVRWTANASDWRPRLLLATRVSATASGGAWQATPTAGLGLVAAVLLDWTGWDGVGLGAMVGLDVPLAGRTRLPTRTLVALRALLW